MNNSVVEKIREKHRYRSDGGKGSGNFGHEGRPGEIGGSSSGGSSKSEKYEKNTKFAAEETKSKAVLKKIKPEMDRAIAERNKFAQMLVDDDGAAKSFDDLSREQKQYVQDIDKVISKINSTEKNNDIHGEFREKTIKELRNIAYELHHNAQVFGEDEYYWEMKMTAIAERIVNPLINTFIYESENYKE